MYSVRIPAVSVKQKMSVFKILFQSREVLGVSLYREDKGSITGCFVISSELLPEKLTVSQLVKKFRTLYGTRKFITAFAKARHLLLCWARSVTSMPDPTFKKFILILFFQLHLGFPSVLFSSRLPAKTLYAPLLSPCLLHTPPIYFFYHPNNIWLVQSIKLLVMYYSPLPCYLVPLRPNPTQHPVLENPQPPFLPQCERPSFTPI